MKVAVLIMSSLSEPSARNSETMKNTFIADTIEMMNNHKFKNKYDFYFYQADETLDEDIKKYEVSSHVYNIDIKIHETIYRTYEKTYFAFETFKKSEYDWFIRINTSMFLNMYLIDNIIKKLDKKNIYCNAINTYTECSCPQLINQLYPRGDLYFLSDNYRNKIINYGKSLLYNDTADKNRLVVDHVDDVLVGIAFINALGKHEYYKYLKTIHYNFLCEETFTGINKYAIGSRVKTIPPGVTYSGYSWDDNEYRLFDCTKMQTLSKLYKNNLSKLLNLYKNITELDILVPKENTRKTPYITIELLPVEELKDKLNIINS